MARRSQFSSTNGHPVPAAITNPDDISSYETSTTVPLDRDSDSEAEQDSPTDYVRSSTESAPDEPTLLPNGIRSLSSIGLQAFWTGFALATCLLLTPYFALTLISTLWRLPAFIACLSLFHFLEYYTTARFNPPAVRASSFLIFSNGRQYAIAHSCAMLEILVSSFLPAYQEVFVWSPWTIALGAMLVLIGQAVRSLAMAQAGTNFNHTPAKVRKEGHVLVTSGVYSVLRHPSYFGFFWWALGTQLLVGNKICLVGYALALWKFFDGRIRAEEWTLTEFFGNDYEVFRKRTPTGIPFVR